MVRGLEIEEDFEPTELTHLVCELCANSPQTVCVLSVVYGWELPASHF